MVGEHNAMSDIWCTAKKVFYCSFRCSVWYYRPLSRTKVAQATIIALFPGTGTECFYESIKQNRAGQIWYNRQLGMDPSPSPINAEWVTLFVILNIKACIFVLIFSTCIICVSSQNIQRKKPYWKTSQFIYFVKTFLQKIETLCMYFKPGKISMTGFRIS